MKIEREEIRTGLLMTITIGVFVAVVLFLGAPGLFVAQKKYRIFFDNAAALKPGAEVLLAGRKIGRVESLFSPVPEADRPEPKMEAMVEIAVEADARIYLDARAAIAQPRILGDPVIDFTLGKESSGLAPDGHKFLGHRPPGIEEMVPKFMEQVEPVMKKAAATFDSLQETASGPLHRSIANIEALTQPDGELRRTLDNMEKMTGPESDLALTLQNTRQIVSRVVEQGYLEESLKNFRQASRDFQKAMDDLTPRTHVIARNLEQASDTIKRQPWRLIWPGTKKYPGQDSKSAKPD